MRFVHTQILGLGRSQAGENHLLFRSVRSVSLPESERKS